MGFDSANSRHTGACGGVYEVVMRVAGAVVDAIPTSVLVEVLVVLEDVLLVVVLVVVVEDVEVVVVVDVVVVVVVGTVVVVLVVVVVELVVVVVVVVGTQVSALPLQVPPEQGVPRAWKVHVAVQHEAAVPSFTPSSQCSPGSTVPLPQTISILKTPPPVPA
jgi:hypothetical protein